MRFNEQKAVFDTWLSTYKGVLFKVVRAYATKRQDQEDLFQEIATQVWISVPGFEGNAARSSTTAPLPNVERRISTWGFGSSTCCIELHAQRIRVYRGSLSRPREHRLAAVHLRKVRSFVRRPGRITAAQRRALDELMPRFGIAAGSARLDLAAAFGRDAARVLDVGFGDGEALLTSAANHPELDYLGVEVHEPGIGHLLLLLEKAGLTNVRLIARDAAEVVPELLPDGILAAVNLFFPDPWPKKRHHKRRLVQPPFIAELARALRPGGLLHVATDWADYVRHCREIVALETRFAAVDPAEVEGDPLAFRPPTKFERRGRRLGHDVVDLYYRSRK